MIPLPPDTAEVWRSPIWCLGCGCIGIPLGRPGTFSNSEECLVFINCDTEDDRFLSGTIRSYRKNEIAQGYRLQEEDFRKLQFTLQKQLYLAKLSHEVFFNCRAQERALEDFFKNEALEKIQ